jgi:hypothetical protein
MTRSELRSMVRRLLGEPEGSYFTDAKINSALYEACIEMASEVEKVRGITSLSSEPGVAEYPLPAKAFKIVAITRNDNECELDYRTDFELDLDYPTWRTSTAGVPAYWYLGNQTHYFGLYPKPASSETIKIYWIGIPADFANDAEEPVFPLAYHRGLVYKAAAILLRGDAEAKGDARIADFEARYARYVAQYMAQGEGGTVTSTTTPAAIPEPPAPPEPPVPPPPESAPVGYFGYITSYGTEAQYAWEAEHYNLVNCGDTASLVKHKTDAPGLPQYRYDLLRYISPLDFDKLNFLQDYAESHAGKAEDYFVHYSEDTRLVLRTSSNTKLTHDNFLRCWFYNGGSYSSKGDYYAAPASFVFGSSTSEILYLGYSNPFNEVNIPVNAASGEAFHKTWEYWNGAAWSALSVTDGTANLIVTGKVEFDPPADWARGTVNGLKCYWARMRCTSAGTAPVIGGGTGIKPASYIVFQETYNSSNNYYVIPGWDETADSDGDGYLNASEWAARATGKNARFKYQARVPGREYIFAWSWMVNMGDSGFLAGINAWLEAASTTQYSGFTYDGIMFDEFLPGFNYWLYLASSSSAQYTNPVTGGAVYEYSKPGNPNWGTANGEYDADTVVALGEIRSALHGVGKSLGINLGRTYWTAAEGAVDFILREMLFYSTSDASHLTSIANNTTAASIFKRDHAGGVICLAQHQKGLVNYIATAGDRDKYLGLAMFYLLQDPTKDYFQSWYGTSYGAAKSESEYVPAAVCKIGGPTGNIPAGYSELSGPDAKMFSLASGSCPATGKTYQVLAREYDDALVVVKPRPAGASSNAVTFGDGSLTTVALPATSDNPTGAYYLVQYDGTPAVNSITQISLRNGEGAILLKVTKA